MRASTRRHHHEEEEEESAFISMTDMTVGFLFIVILLLAFFASSYSDQDTVPKAIHQTVVAARDAVIDENKRLQAEIENLQQRIEGLEAELDDKKAEITDLTAKLEAAREEIERLKSRIRELERTKVDELELYQAQAVKIRQEILKKIRDSLNDEFKGIDAQVSAEGDALRLQGEGLFNSGQDVLKPGKDGLVRGIAARLDAELPCFTFGARQDWKLDCNPYGVVIEAVQIEGHTDSSGDDVTNLELSTRRANNTFKAMWAAQPDMLAHQNSRNLPVMSVAGYGEMRPARSEAEGGDTARAANRRIDLRIIMHTPLNAAEIQKIKQRFASKAVSP